VRRRTTVARGFLPIRATSGALRSLKANPDGSFVYTPTGNNFGLDSFKYRANDGTWSRDPSQPMSDNSNEVTVTINIVKK